MNIPKPDSSYDLPPTELIKDPLIRHQLNILRESEGGLILPVLWSVENKTTICDLAEKKDLLVIGAQGQGKSNFLHQILLSLLFNRRPDQVKFLLMAIRGAEFNPYCPIVSQYLVEIPGLPSPIVSQTIYNALIALQSLRLEIEYRNKVFTRFNARDIGNYHKQMSQQIQVESGAPRLPYIVVAVDELGDLHLQHQKQLRLSLEQIFSEARKVGIIFLMSASIIPANLLPSSVRSGIEQRIIFRLFEREDYRRFLDTVKLPSLQTAGEFLYRESRDIIRGKTISLTAETIDDAVDHIRRQPYTDPPYCLPALAPATNHDPLFEDAARLIVRNQLGSFSLLQRRMKLGYNRAGFLIDQLEAAGIVGPGLGSKPRDVLIKTERELDVLLARYSTKR